MNGDVLASFVVQAATAAMAAYGAWRCMRLQRFAADRRLTALAWFFGLFAAAVALNAAWQLQLGLGPGPGPGFNNLAGPPSNGTDGGRIFFFRTEGSERVNLWLAGHHALMLAALVVGVWAFGSRRGEAGTVSPMLAASFLGFVGDLVPSILALEAGIALYLAVRAYLNHVQVRSPGAVQVALGFLLFFVGHLLFSVAHQPGMGHAAMGDVLNLVGLILLVQVLPPAPAAALREGA